MNHECFYCKRPTFTSGGKNPTPPKGFRADQRLTREHLTPKSKGGGNGVSNIVYACFRCNQARATEDFFEFAMFAARYLRDGPLQHIRQKTVQSLFADWMSGALPR